MYKGIVGIPTLAMVDDLAKISECGVDSVKDNSFINARIEQDKQLFNCTKCHQMHVGKSSKFCPLLRAHLMEIDIVTEEKYVGDIVSNDGKHTKNVQARRSKGIGMCNEIITILDNLYLGQYHFQIALLLRQAMLLSVLLFNADTWLRLSKDDLRKLESIDLMFLRKLFGVPISTPKPSLYLESGCMPLRYVIKGKRIMFLHHILTRNEDALISRVFWAQVTNTAKGDWCQVVREDLDMLGLSMLSFEEIATMTKDSLKKLVHEGMTIAAFDELGKEKNDLKKIAPLRYNELGVQPYLTDPDLSVKQKQLIFKWRTCMIKVGWNYGQKDKCPICSEADDTQAHLFNCRQLNPDNMTDYDCGIGMDKSTEHMKILEAAIRSRGVLARRCTGACPVRFFKNE